MKNILFWKNVLIPRDPWLTLALLTMLIMLTLLLLCIEPQPLPKSASFPTPSELNSSSSFSCTSDWLPQATMLHFPAMWHYLNHPFIGAELRLCGENSELELQVGTCRASPWTRTEWSPTISIRDSQNQSPSLLLSVCLINRPIHHSILWLLEAQPRPQSVHTIENQASSSWCITHTTKGREDRHSMKHHKITYRCLDKHKKQRQYASSWNQHPNHNNPWEKQLSWYARQGLTSILYMFNEFKEDMNKYQNEDWKNIVEWNNKNNSLYRNRIKQKQSLKKRQSAIKL